MQVSEIFSNIRNQLTLIKRKQNDANDHDDKNHHSNHDGKKKKISRIFFEVSNSNELDFNKLKNDYQFFLNEMVNIKQK